MLFWSGGEGALINYIKIVKKNNNFDRSYDLHRLLCKTRLVIYYRTDRKSLGRQRPKTRTVDWFSSCVARSSNSRFMIDLIFPELFVRLFCVPSPSAPVRRSILIFEEGRPFFTTSSKTIWPLSFWDAFFEGFFHL